MRQETTIMASPRYKHHIASTFVYVGKENRTVKKFKHGVSDD